MELSGTERMSTKEVMDRVGHTYRQNFWRAFPKLDIPHVRINSRRVLFYRKSVEGWLEDRMRNQR